MNLKLLLYGAATFMPGINWHRTERTGGTDSARYCYSVWLRHLVQTHHNALNPYPKIVAELGPGDSIGIGLAALISGCDEYFAFDVIEHINVERNMAIFEELVTLFKNRAAIPGDDEWPEVNPQLQDYRFPSDILDDSRLRNALEPSRIERIKSSITDLRREDSVITYRAPWNDANTLQPESVDMIYSQAVLEHVDDLKNAYSAMYSWLKPGGHISHAIDFRCHGTANKWNGHWLYSDLIWRLIRGKRPYLLNREPHSTHIRLIKSEGFEIICDIKSVSESEYTINQLAPRFRSISQIDLVTSGAFIQGVKYHAFGG